MGYFDRWLIKANPYHDSDGKFTSAESDASGGGGLEKLNSIKEDEMGEIATDSIFDKGVVPGAQVQVPATAYKEVMVKLKDLATSQMGLDKEKVAANIKNPVEHTNLTAVDFGEGPVIQDGHHAIAAAILSGKTEMKIKVAVAESATFDEDVGEYKVKGWKK